MPSWESRGIESVPSPRPVEETLARLDGTVRSAGLTVFARIEFSGDAARAGLTMRPAQLLVFGNPKAGTPLMVAAPSVALDLPLKALVWEDAEGHVWVSYNTPNYLKERHGVPDDLIGNIAGIAALVRRAVA
ncbi:MAG TPA: DUF302 domain-containing protein [bacterium]|nr:DUF302 domain-containing protein [bacterium]